MVRTRAKIPTSVTRKDDVTGHPGTDELCANCGKVVRGPAKLCQPCVSRLQKIHAAGGPALYRCLSTILRAGDTREQTRISQKWVRSWHKRNCALAKEVKALRSASKVKDLKIARLEKKRAGQPANQAAAEIAKFGNFQLRKAAKF